MNLDNICVGDTIKNYKELCRLLEVEEKSSGKGRKYHLNELGRYFDFERIGQKFIITEIYDEPLDKIDGRVENSIYIKYFEIVLLRYLMEQEGYCKTMTKKSWWELLGLTNERYGKKDKRELKKLNGYITDYEINHFYQRTASKLEKILFRSLDSLKSRCLIDYTVQTMVVTLDNNHRLATKEEIKYIIGTMNEVLKMFGYTKMIQVFMSFKQEQFYNEVNNILSEKYGILYSYKVIEIIYSKPHIKNDIPIVEAELKRELLNSNIVQSINKNAEIIYEKRCREYEKETDKIVEKYINGEEITKEDTDRIWKVPEYYLEAQDILTNYLIKKNEYTLLDYINNNLDNFVIND